MLSGTIFVTRSGRKPGQPPTAGDFGSNRSRNDPCQPGLSAGMSTAFRSRTTSRSGRYSRASMSATVISCRPTAVRTISSPARTSPSVSTRR